jgi:hypothetical protein
MASGNADRDEYTRIGRPPVPSDPGRFESGRTPVLAQNAPDLLQLMGRDTEYPKIQS